MDSVQDVSTKLSVRLEDHYFVSITLGNYEIKFVERPVFSQTNVIRIRSWEGRVHEAGLDVQVDINNRLRSIVDQRSTDLNRDEIAHVFDLHLRTVSGVLAEFIQTANLNLDSLRSSTT